MQHEHTESAGSGQACAGLILLPAGKWVSRVMLVHTLNVSAWPVQIRGEAHPLPVKHSQAGTQWYSQQLQLRSIPHVCYSCPLSNVLPLGKQPD